MKQGKKKLIRPRVRIKKSEIHGYGVFAAKRFNKDEIIEECPVLLLKNNDYTPTLDNYVFTWETQGEYALALGYGSLYNHSEKPNANFYRDPENGLIIFTASRTIFRGEELLIRYADDWFKKRNMEIRNPKSTYKRHRILNLIFWTLLLLGLIIFLTITKH